MVSACIQAEELAVHHVGDPGDRVPVGLAIRDYRIEGPQEILGSKTILHMGIVKYIDIIVEMDELMALHLPVDCKSCYG